MEIAENMRQTQAMALALAEVVSMRRLPVLEQVVAVGCMKGT
jgi:hypothetical protein